MLAKLLFAAFGGASAALAVAAYLSRTFIRLQTEKLLARHSQALAIEKDRLGHDLSVELHRKSLSITRRESDKTEALKALYSVVVELDMAVIKVRSLANVSNQPNFRAAYFTSLNRIFSELAETFSKISEAHKILELKSIYLDDATETKMKAMLLSIQSYYDAVLRKCNAVLKSAQDLGAALSEKTQPVALPALALEIVEAWNNIVEPSKKQLRDAIRQALML